MPGPIITSPLSGRSVELGRPGQHENIGVFRSDLYASLDSKSMEQSRYLSNGHSVTTVSSVTYRKDAPLPRKAKFAQHLRDARIRRGLSVAEVAEQVGVSQSSIYFWETDHCRPRDGNLAALCRALKLPIKATRAMSAG